MNSYYGLKSADQTQIWQTDGSAAIKSQPVKEGTVTHTRLNEKVKVYALYQESADSRFPHDKLRPMMFIWRNQEHHVQDVTYVWRENHGQSEVYHFTVTDGANVFELCYHARTFDWTLAGVFCE